MSARKAKRSERSPRRKAGRTSAPKAKAKISFRLVVEGQEMLVDYTPDWSGGAYPFGHFEFRSPHEPPRRIVISETGYRSQFESMAVIRTYASPEEYARSYVLSFLNQARKGKPRPRDGEQLALF